MKQTIAKWESRGKKYWLELYVETNSDDGMRDFSYKGDGCGGFIGQLTYDQAMNHCRAIVSCWPSKAKEQTFAHLNIC